METTSDNTLSDYQLTILNVMGISAWELVDHASSSSQIEELPKKSSTTTSKAESQKTALAKLAQLKGQTQAVEDIDAVLLVFPQDEVNWQIINDILLVLGLAEKNTKHISCEQLAEFSGYPLSWIIGQELQLTNNHIVTPAIAELNHAPIKKKLWQRLHSVSQLSKNSL